MKELEAQRAWDDALVVLEHQLENDALVSNDDMAFLLQLCGNTMAFTKLYQAHKFIVWSGHGSNVFLNNTLIDLYSKCGRLADACTVFASMPMHNVFSWTAIIRAHAIQNRLEMAISLFREMVGMDVVPDDVIFVVILKACASLRTWTGKELEVHAYVVEYGYESLPLVANTLIFMHAEVGRLDYARTVFKKLREPDLVSWNTLIMGYAQEGLNREALVLFHKMQETSPLDDITLLSVLKACIGLEELNDGMRVHAVAVENGLDLGIAVGSSFVDMYAKCHSTEHAYVLFNKLEERNVVSWTGMITGFTQEGDWASALALFEEMQLNSCSQPNELTYASVLCACSGLPVEGKGREVHSNVVRKGYEHDVFIVSALVDMYANCGLMDDAMATFKQCRVRNVVMWNSLLNGYVEQGFGDEALKLFERIRKEGVNPDDITYVCALKACTLIDTHGRGKEIHSDIIKSGAEVDAFVATSLVVMYVNWGSMEHSQYVFDNTRSKDIVSWNALIMGYSLYGPYQLAFSLFDKMQYNTHVPTKSTYVSLVKACASLAALEQGQCILMHAVKSGLEPDLLLDSSLIDLFSKCGSLDDANHVFECMRAHDVVSWTAIITAYAQQGLAKDVFSLYERMTHEGVQPNEVTFLSVLNACSHTGMLHEAFRYFDSMRDAHGITPTTSHYACLIDLLGRAGHLAEVVDLISKLLADTDEVMLLALLGACQSFNSMELARQVVEQLLEKKTEVASAYVILSNISAV